MRLDQLLVVYCDGKSHLTINESHSTEAAPGGALPFRLSRDRLEPSSRIRANKVHSNLSLGVRYRIDGTTKPSIRRRRDRNTASSVCRGTDGDRHHPDSVPSPQVRHCAL